jgi:hypothetical protein
MSSEFDGFAVLPLPESTDPTTFVPSVYPADYVPDANWTATAEQRGRLRYWDFVIYWMDYHVRRQQGVAQEPVETPRSR